MDLGEVAEREPKQVYFKSNELLTSFECPICEGRDGFSVTTKEILLVKCGGCGVLSQPKFRLVATFRGFEPVESEVF